MSVKPQAYQKSSTPERKTPQWEPHYLGRVSQYSVDKLTDPRFAWVDSRKIRELILNNQLLLELWDNPMNDGKGVVVTAKGFQVLADPSEESNPGLEQVGDFLCHPLGKGFRIWSISVPLGIGKLALSFRSIRTVAQDGTASFRIANF